jgi:hypothetical protein
MRKFAILFSGGVMPSANYPRYLNDLREIYRTLVQQYGYAKGDIFTFYADGSPRDLDGDGGNEIYADGRGGEFVALCQDHIHKLPKLMTDEDLLFIFTTNHGHLVDAATRQAGLWFWQWDVGNPAWMHAREFARLINDFLKFKYLIACMGQCYSGGFIDDLAGDNRVIMTACRHDEPSWACDTEGDYDEFLYHWTAAVRGRTPEGPAVNADTDGDGRVSLREAFLYAAGRDSRPETPQYYESPAGLGSRLTLSGPLR